MLKNPEPKQNGESVRDLVGLFECPSPSDPVREYVTYVSESFGRNSAHEVQVPRYPPSPPPPTIKGMKGENKSPGKKKKKESDGGQFVRFPHSRLAESRNLIVRLARLIDIRDPCT